MHTLESTPEGPKSGSSGSDFRSDPRWRLVERILQTGPFQKSTNLSALLSYLAEHSILGKAESITERQIGIAVFGKPSGYSPSEDSAVRVHVRQLRLRLHEYFALEGRIETLHADIPKGSYVLEFQDAGPQPQAVPSPAPTPQAIAAPSPKPRRNLLREMLFWGAIATAVVCAIGWYRAAKANAHPSAPWPLNAVIQPGQQTRVVVSDSSLMLRLLGNHETTLNEYLQPGYRQSLVPPHMPESVGRLLYYISDSQLTSFADAAAVSMLMNLSGPLGSQLVLTSARDLNRRDLEQGNYVFVGSPTSNPWVSLFADKLNFQEVEETVGGRVYFRNRHPLPGEQQIYEGLPTTGSTGEDYATISLLPGAMGQGNIMVLQGLRQGGTEALTALLADAADRERLEKTVQRKANSASPYFEALIRSQAVAGAPVSLNIVAVRTIQP